MPARSSWDACRPTSIAHRKTAAFAAPPSRAFCRTFAYTFSKIRGTAQTKVGRVAARFSTILSTRPSTAVGNPIRSCAVPIIFPKTWASGSQKNWNGSGWFRNPESSIAFDCATQAAWVSSTPFGRPVVPEV